jgi:hypothetical protein
MLELVELQFQYIGRFTNKQTVRFDALGNFIQVDGQNNNTGGSSGAAKSTIFMALDYLFGFPGTRPATVLQSRKIINPEENDIWVQARLKQDDDEITILRTKGNVQITIAGEIIKKTRAEEKIDTLLGMPRDLFRKTMHKRQGEGGFFLNLGPTEMHDFLMDCIGLSSFKPKLAIIDAELKILEENITKTNQSIEKDMAGFSATQDAILTLGLAPTQDMHQNVVDELKTKADKSYIALVEQKSLFKALLQEHVCCRPDAAMNHRFDTTIIEDLERRKTDIEAQMNLELEGERNRQEKIRRQITEKSLEKSAVLYRIDKSNRAKADATKIADEIKSIDAHACPTCSQEWKTQSATETKRTKLTELVSLRSIIEDGVKCASAVDTLDLELFRLKTSAGPILTPELSNLNESLTEVVEQILQEKIKAKALYDRHTTEFKQKLDEWSVKQAELQHKCDIELDQFRGQADLDRRVYEAALNKLQNYQTNKANYDDSYNKLKKQEEIFQKRIESCKIDLKNHNELQIFASESQKAIKYYVAFSFEEALDAISEKATQIIRCIPNTSNATIQLEGTRETGRGVVKEEVNAVISVDGETGVPIKSFSGGERSSTDLAVDLAVIDYIETKTGKGLNIFILDEPFQGLGTVEIEMALEVLKNSNINKKLIIVSHNVEVKQMVQNRLIAIRDGLTSRVAA